MDTTPVRDAFDALLDAAAAVAASGDPAPPSGEWNADQILAHVSILTAGTIAVVGEVASGAHTTFDNRLSQDSWTIARVVSRVGGTDGLLARLRIQAEALCTLVGGLTEAELEVLVPTLLLSNDEVLLEQPISLRDLIGGLEGTELPGHAKQLLALLPDG
jgi:hypothetical protein